MMKRSLLVTFAAAAISTTALVAPALVTPAAAEVGVNISIGSPPPAPLYEVVPAHRAGYVWAPGYWNWSGNRHVWAPGRYVAERPGYRYVPDRWDSYRDGDRDRWQHHAGHWENDGPRGNKGDHNHDGHPDNGRGPDKGRR